MWAVHLQCFPWRFWFSESILTSCAQKSFLPILSQSQSLYLTSTPECQGMNEHASPFCAKTWNEAGGARHPLPSSAHTAQASTSWALLVWCWLLSGQVFVANPNKTQPILDILLKNQTKLIEFLSKFQNDRTEDEQFNDEKTYLVKQIRDLKRPAQQEA